LILEDIINRNRAVYTAATTNREKKEITERLRLEIGGRFVRLCKEELNRGVVISKEEARIKIAQSLQYRNRKRQEGTSTTKQRSNSHADGAIDVTSMQSDIPLGVCSNDTMGPQHPAPVFGVHNSPYLPTANSYPSTSMSFVAHGYAQWIAPPQTPPPPMPMPSFGSLSTNASVAAPDTMNHHASHPFNATSTTTTTVVSNEEIRWALGVSSVPPPEIASQLGISSNSQHTRNVRDNFNIAEPEQPLGDDSEDTAIGVAFTDLSQAQPPQPAPPPAPQSSLQSWPPAR
jgi:hypothetical protein